MSFQIINFEFSNKIISLSYPTNLTDEHKFTIITGKNGVGKSRLLVSIVSKYLSKESNNHDLIKNNKPNKVIAVSNIKNDKFPIKRNKTDRYHYIGNRTNIPLQNNDRFFVFKNLLCNENLNYSSVSQTFDYLGFKSNIQIDFQTLKTTYYSKISQINIFIEIYERYSEYFDEFIPNEINLNFNSFLNKIKKLNTLREKNYINENPSFLEFDYSDSFLSKSKSIEISDKKFSEYIKELNNFEILFLECLGKIYLSEHTISKNIFMKLSRIILENRINEHLKGVIYNFNQPNSSNLFNDLIFLLRSDLIRISNIYLLENHTSQLLRFFDLSSGQQSLFNIMLGISGVIEDGSLICIDEPEVNLHPEWQTELIVKLQSIFKHIKGCHFIIATHSPQIVSGLNSELGYVVDLECNVTHTIDDYSKKSADYQLANIFGYPGYNNEYLIRIALTLLSKITQKINFNENDLDNLNVLNNSKKDLPENDPVYFLIEQINALV